MVLKQGAGCGGGGRIQTQDGEDRGRIKWGLDARLSFYDMSFIRNKRSVFGS